MRLVYAVSIIVILSVVGIEALNAQQNASIWTDQDEVRMNPAGGRNIVPQIYRTLRADINGLRDVLSNAPQERITSPDASPSHLRIPRPEGGFDVFKIVEYAMV